MIGIGQHWIVRNIDMFYTLTQNNSGGDWIENDEVRQYVIVEADTKTEALDWMKAITEDHSDYCECCGERWWYYSLECNDTPSISNDSLYDELNKKRYDDSYIIYYKDGRKEFKEI